jgi:hypothetical protein
LKITRNIQIDETEPRHYPSGKHTQPAQGSLSALIASISDTSGQIANNLHAACGVEEGIVTTNARKKKIRTPHQTAATVN